MSEKEFIEKHNVSFEAFMDRYSELARNAKRNNRVVMNHVCVRVSDLGAAEDLLCKSFGITNFNRPGGQMFKGEKELSVAWVNEEMFLELMEPTEEQHLGFDTGCGVPIGHLSELGFFTPDMDKELARLATLGWKVTGSIEEDEYRMVKVDTEEPSGFPVELIEIKSDGDDQAGD